MNKQEYATWWQLHVRASRGEFLDEQERAAYKTGLEHFHNEETLVERPNEE